MSKIGYLDLRTKTEEELTKQLEDLKRELATLRVGNVSSREKSSKIKIVRASIARVKRTIRCHFQRKTRAMRKAQSLEMAENQTADLNDSIEVIDFGAEFKDQLEIYDSKLYDTAENVDAGRRNLIKWVEGILEEKNKIISTLSIKVRNARLLQNKYKPLEDSVSNDKLGEGSWTHSLTCYDGTVKGAFGEVNRLEKEVRQMKKKLTSAEKESMSLRTQLLSSKLASKKESQEASKAKEQAARLSDKLKLQEDAVKGLQIDLSTEKAKHANYVSNTSLVDPMSQAQEASKAKEQAVRLRDKLKLQEDTIKGLQMDLSIEKAKHANYVSNSSLVDPISQEHNMVKKQDHIKYIETKWMKQNSLLGEIELELNQVNLLGDYISSKINGLKLIRGAESSCGAKNYNANPQRSYVSLAIEEMINPVTLKIEELKTFTQKSLQKIKDNRYSENTQPSNPMLSFQGNQDVQPIMSDKPKCSTNVKSLVPAPQNKPAHLSVLSREINKAQNSTPNIPIPTGQISFQDAHPIISDKPRCSTNVKSLLGAPPNKSALLSVLSHEINKAQNSTPNIPVFVGQTPFQGPSNIWQYRSPAEAKRIRQTNPSNEAQNSTPNIPVSMGQTSFLGPSNIWQYPSPAEAKRIRQSNPSNGDENAEIAIILDTKRQAYLRQPLWKQ